MGIDEGNLLQIVMGVERYIFTSSSYGIIKVRISVSTWCRTITSTEFQIHDELQNFRPKRAQVRTVHITIRAKEEEGELVFRHFCARYASQDVFRPSRLSSRRAYE